MFSFSGRYEGYRLNDLRKDMSAGLIVGIIAIPLGMAFAIASGVKPEYGIYSTIVGSILIALLGGSKYQVGGPTGAFIPLLFAVVMQYGYENLLIVGFMAGIILVLMGIFKLGALLKFIPRPVIIGFTSGIAIIIFSGQIASFLGLSDVQKHVLFIDNMKEIGWQLHTLNGYSIVTALICLGFILYMPKIAPKVPGVLSGLLVSSAIAFFFFGGQVATIGSTFGVIPSGLPSLHWPPLTLAKIIELLKPAFVIAMLGSVESLLSAVVADGMGSSRHNSNRELIGQGVANMVAPLFGGIPVTGAIARTATNIKNGAVSPLSGVFSGIVVLLVLLLFAPFASHIPLASMAPVLMIVAWNMSERKEFVHLLKTKTSDSVVMGITFMLTVLIDLTTAVEVGLVLAVIFFVKRMSEIMSVEKGLPDPSVKNAKVVPHMVTAGHDCPQISILTVEGPLFFGAARLFEQMILNAIVQRPNIVLLRMGKVPFMDMTGTSNLSGLIKKYRLQGGILLISNVQKQPHDCLSRAGIYDLLGRENFYHHTGEAIDYALTKVDPVICRGCKNFAFNECIKLSNPVHEDVVVSS